MNDILIIANPASGKYKIFKPLLHKIIDILKQKADKVELTLTKYRGHGTILAQASDSNIIIAAGGDGLINEVAKGVVNTDKLFYALPLGTKNVFCKEYGISSNPLHAAKLLDINHIKQIPVGFIENKIFLLMAGFGFDAHVVKKVEDKGVRFRLLKTLTHVIRGVPAFFSDKYPKMTSLTPSTSIMDALHFLKHLHHYFSGLGLKVHIYLQKILKLMGLLFASLMVNMWNCKINLLIFLLKKKQSI